MPQTNMYHRANRLANEKSPYLLQHAHNPVDWYPWSDEAFDKARAEDKPIFLSIGYSTCHWCHVMERESFEETEVADLLNQTFVCIKVDREERPDIDSTYMSVCQMMTGSGGWPLTILMTHEKKPFYATTYIPKQSRFGRLGMLEFVPKIRKLWETRRDEILKSAQDITELMQKEEQVSVGESISESTLHIAFTQLSRLFDEKHGGFGSAPKFPTPHHLTFLLRYYRRTGYKRALEMVEKTLSAMRLGGIYDHIGFGFHRYSTDAMWFLPHFEKMLYDQAMLAMAYLECYQVTGDRTYEATSKEIFEWVIGSMQSQEGGFYSALDADSEGEEGKFYVWREEEVRQILDSDDARLAIKVLNVKESGNYVEETGGHTGTNVLYLEETLSEIASELGMEEYELQTHIEQIRVKLLGAREKRIHPHCDDKILTDWNGLMIAALAKGTQVLGNVKYAEAAENAVRFILSKMRHPAGGLYHSYRDGEAKVMAFLDDYAFLIWGLIELYEATFAHEYLEEALELNSILLDEFWDEDHYGFFFTGSSSEHVIVRRKEVYDGAVPSGNSVALLNLLRLGRITGNPDLEARSDKMMRAFFQTITASPVSYTQFLNAVDFALTPSCEVVITGDSRTEDTKTMLRALRQPFIPNKVMLFVPAEDGASSVRNLAAFTRNLEPLDGKATAYVCKNYNCALPTTEIKKTLELLQGNV